MNALRFAPLLALLAGCGDPASAPADAVIPTSSERGTFALDIQHDDGAFRRGANAFTVLATDAQGMPASVTGVSATMPGHGHAITPPRIDCAGGSCRVSDLVLPMPGVWEITLQLARPGEQDDVTLSPTLH